MTNLANESAADFQYKDFRIATRALIVQENKLLFVSDDGHFWYLPGGRVDRGEDLKKCIEREVYEETGLIIKAGQMAYVQEMLDIRDAIHKIFFYFHTTLVSGTVDDNWKDSGGAVRYRKFLSLEEINNNETVIPRFLAKGFWLNIAPSSIIVDPVYQGFVFTRGFEVVKDEELETLLMM